MLHQPSCSRLGPVKASFQIEPTCQPGQKGLWARARIEVHGDVILALFQSLPDRFENEQVTAQKIALGVCCGKVLKILAESSTGRWSRQRRPAWIGRDDINSVIERCTGDALRSVWCGQNRFQSIGALGRRTTNGEYVGSDLQGVARLERRRLI